MRLEAEHDQADGDAGNAEPDRPFPAHIIAGADTSDLLILCDHARNWIPPHYQDLGLSEADLAKHIAYDIGAEALTVSLAGALGAWAVLSNFSRLLIDPNRGESDPTLILTQSDGTAIPGNADVDADERRRRIDTFYAPYHHAIETTIEGRMAAGFPPVIVSIHSFTPIWHGEPRPWHVGVLWDSDPDLARKLIDRLNADTTIKVGDNEPYSGKAPTNSTLNRHGTRLGLSHVLLEIRQDLIADPAGVQHWTERLTSLLSDL